MISRRWRGFTNVFRSPPERTDEDARTIAKLAAYRHVSTKHPETLGRLLGRSIAAFAQNEESRPLSDPSDTSDT